MQLINIDNLPIVDSFIRLYGEQVEKFGSHYKRDIEFHILRKDQNEFSDIMGRISNRIYLSPEEVGRIGLSDPEILASLAHEIGHIIYNTHSWEFDCEQRADSLAAELGLGSQMICAIEKILESHRFPRLTSMLVGRIHFLQNYLLAS